MSHCWKSVLVKPSTTLLEALEVINKEALRVAIVANEKMELLGVITDGDIRRGLLRNLPLSSEVVDVMTQEPITANVGTSSHELVKLMESKGILSIPILDQNGIIVGLETLQQSMHNTKKFNPVFIMAGGFGTRLRPLTDSCPKPMLNIGNKPILETVIKSFIKAGFVNFYISTHYMPEKIKSYFGDGTELGVNITYVHEESPLGTGGALGLLPKNLPKNLPLIMMNGDILTKVDFCRLLDFHNDNDAFATMCVREYDYQIPYGVISGEGNTITSMVEKPVHRFFVNAGIYVLSPNLVDTVPKNVNIDMPTLLQANIDKSKKVLMFPIHEYWLDIGQIDDFNRAQADIHTLEII